MLLFVVALGPLLSTPLLPFIDLYNHLARYYVLAHLADSPTLAHYYAANWSLLPNIGLDVIGSTVLHVLPPQFVAHVVVAAILAVQYAGVLTFNRVLTGRWSLLVGLLLVPLLYSFILNWGFANFLLGLGLTFWAAAWWLAMRHRLAVAVPVACVAAVVIFLCHGLAFALYGILVGSLEIGLFLRLPTRRLTVLVRALIPVAVQAVVPIVMFAAAKTSDAADGVSNVDGSIARLARSGELGGRLWELLWHRLTTIVRVAEGPSLLFDVVASIAVVAVLAVLIRRGSLSIARTAWPALVVAGLLVVITPPALFGVGYVADRMPLFFALILVGALSMRPGADERSMTGLIAALVALRLVAIAVGWQAYAADYARFRNIAAQVPAGSLVDDVMVGGSPRDSSGSRCSMYRPLMVSLDGAIAPLFANETQQPLRLVGPLRRAVERLPAGHAWGNPQPGYYDDVIAAAGPAGFDYLLVCNVEGLTRPLPPGAGVVARTPLLTLIKLDQPARRDRPSPLSPPSG